MSGGHRIDEMDRGGVAAFLEVEMRVLRRPGRRAAARRDRRTGWPRGVERFEREPLVAGLGEVESAEVRRHRRVFAPAPFTSDLARLPADGELELRLGVLGQAQHDLGGDFAGLFELAVPVHDQGRVGPARDAAALGDARASASGSV